MRWPRCRETVIYEADEIDLVFATPAGGLVLRHTVAKLVKQAARTAGIASPLGNHTGGARSSPRCSCDGAESLEDIARFVGHAKPATTAGYVKRLGRRPEAVARRAVAILDAQADEDSQRFGITGGRMGATAGVTLRNFPMVPDGPG